MASPRRPLHSLLSCLALGWLLLHPPTAQADSGECFPSQLKLDIEPLLAEARVALIAQNWTEALRLSRVLQSRIPCVQEPVPASLLSRLFLYEATRAWSQGDQAQSRELLDLALGFFPELEWDSELADARTMLPFLTELEARRVVLQREAPAQLLVQSVGKDQQLYLDGVPYPRSKTPIPVRAGEHLVQQLQRSGKWQGRWLNLKSAETLALEPSFLAAPAAKPLWAMNLSMGQQWRPTLTAEVAVTTQGLSLGMGRALAERSQLWASVGVGYAASGGSARTKSSCWAGLVPCPIVAGWTICIGSQPEDFGSVADWVSWRAVWTGRVRPQQGFPSVVPSASPPKACSAWRGDLRRVPDRRGFRWACGSSWQEVRPFTTSRPRRSWRARP